MSERDFYVLFVRQTGGSVYPGLVAGVDAQKDEEQQGEAPKGGAAVAEEGQRNAYDGHDAHYHAHVDEQMEEEDAQHAVAVDAAEAGELPLAQPHEAQDEREEEEQHSGGAYETLLLAYGAEDEVGVLLGHVLELGLRAVHEAFALKSAGADGYLALVDIVAGAGNVLLYAEEHVDALLLMVAEHVVEAVVGHIEEGG